MLLGFCPASFGVLFCSLVLGFDTHLKLLDCAVSSARFQTGGVCLSVTLLIDNPWQSCVCFVRSGVTQCTLLMVLYLHHMCQCRLHAVLWSHIGSTYAPPHCRSRSTARLLFPSRCPSGMILLTPYSMVWDWRVSRAGPMLFYWPKLLYPYYSLLLFPFLFFLSIGWYCGAGVFGLIGCISLSLSLALPTFFNNNNNKIIPQAPAIQKTEEHKHSWKQKTVDCPLKVIRYSSAKHDVVKVIPRTNLGRQG